MMSFWSRLKKGLAAEVDGPIDSGPAGASQDEKDTLSVIRDLSRVVASNPEAVETYLALGNLFRAKGDLETAVQIRENLLVRPSLNSDLRARAYFELGQDYRRAGLMDRALDAYHEAGRMGVSARLIDTELAALYAEAGDWLKAAQYSKAVGNSEGEAHYLVRQALETLRSDAREGRKAMRLASKALKVYPASPEAWALLVTQQAREDKWAAAGKTLQKALEEVSPDKNFMLFEELMELKPAKLTDAGEFYDRLLSAFLPVLENRPPELAPYYYGARVLKEAGRVDEAEAWLNKALIIQPEFWAGRLLQLEIARLQYGLPPSMDSDLDFFIAESQKQKRFVCTVCGLSRDTLFYCCQRCRNWHSAAYKFTLSD
ncbi:hypothetical protein LJC36_00760 [Desulfovibrio sp. OttesenSCG-928-C14]|nr:hypothetical protein [Desulfovibrio sp. OttesenSCG-928-C14]